MKAKQLHDMSTKELNTKLAELKEELFFLRLKHATNQVTNPMLIAECKKDIARLLTILRERELKGEDVKAEAAEVKSKSKPKAKKKAKEN